MATEHSFCGGSYLHHCRHERCILNFPAPSAPSLSYWIFLRKMNRTVWPFFLSYYLVWFASSAFCRLNLFAFLEYNTKIQLWWSLERVSPQRVLTTSYWSQWWALAPSLCFYYCWSLSSFQRILVTFLSHYLCFQLLVRPHSFRRWHHCNKFSSTWSDLTTKPTGPISDPMPVGHFSLSLPLGQH